MTKKTLVYIIKTTEEFTEIFDEAEARLREYDDNEDPDTDGMCGTGTKNNED